MGTVNYVIDNCLQEVPFFQHFRIRHWITKHIQKDGTEKLVGEVYGLLTFATYGIGLIQNNGDAFLLF